MDDDIPTHAPGAGWDPVELLEEYARLAAIRRDLDGKMAQLKDALVDIARDRHMDEVATSKARMTFKRGPALEVRDKPAVLEVLERHRLLAPFVVLNTRKLHDVASEHEDVMDELGASVEPATRLTAHFSTRTKP